MDKIVARILERYGVDCRRVLAVQKGYRNSSYPVELTDGSFVNLIIYKREAGIERRVRLANDAGGWLAAQGLPARRPLGPVLRLNDGRQTRYAGLYDYRPGRTIAWEAYRMNHIKLLGKAMGLLHARLREYVPTGGAALPDAAEANLALLARMEDYFGDSGVRSALRGKLAMELPRGVFAELRAALRASGRLPGRQALHLDFVRGNVLFADGLPASDAGLGRNIAMADGTCGLGDPRGRMARCHSPELPGDWLHLDGTHRPAGQNAPGTQNSCPRQPYLTGILDFETVAAGPPLLDVARTLAFLLVDCRYKTPRQVSKYFLRSGYGKRGGGRLGHDQLALLPMMVRFYLLHDFYKFLRHNPYQYLPRNEHFARTRGFLLKDGIIKPIMVHNSVGAWQPR